jgi:hypothetical protein
VGNVPEAGNTPIEQYAGRTAKIIRNKNPSDQNLLFRQV